MFEDTCLATGSIKIVHIHSLINRHFFSGCAEDKIGEVLTGCLQADWGPESGLEVKELQDSTQRKMLDRRLTLRKRQACKKGQRCSSIMKREKVSVTVYTEKT